MHAGSLLKLFKIDGHMSFYESTDTPVWTSGSISFGFQRQSGQALFAFGKGICDVGSLRLTFSATPADLWPDILTFIIILDLTVFRMYDESTVKESDVKTSLQLNSCSQTNVGVIKRATYSKNGLYYKPPTKVREGSVFTGVCLSKGGELWW